MIFVDTNVFMYAVGRDHPLKAEARRFFEEAAAEAGRPLCTSAEVLQSVAANEELQACLGAPAHLMHSSPENRFRVTWCPGGLTRTEVEEAGLHYGDPGEFLRRYPPADLTDGWNERADGERVYFVRNPALGLWALPDRLTDRL